ncbi:acyl-CoA dehydrogenase family protein [Actinomycetes bacterium KLBMP 9797]
MIDPIERARRVADEVLFPAALNVDESGVLPASHLDLLAREGFYGLAGPDGVADAATAARVVEVLAGGCLATAFVWTQHHGAVRALADGAPPDLVEEWLAPLCRGERRAGIALAALRPGPPSVRVTAVPGGYQFDGVARWVTGWGMIDVLYAAARDERDTILWALVDAVPGPSLAVRPVPLAAVDASATVEVRFTNHFVPAERVTGTLPYPEWSARDAAGLRMNGSFALGVAGRCLALLGPGPLDGELAACRTALDAATPETLPTARAAASELAMRAATTLVATRGARSVRRDDHGQRLLREAMFVLVFGSRPTIKAALLPMIKASLT